MATLHKAGKATGNTARIISPDGTHATAYGGDYLGSIFYEVFREAICSL